MVGLVLATSRTISFKRTCSFSSDVLYSEHEEEPRMTACDFKTGDLVAVDFSKTKHRRWFKPTNSWWIGYRALTSEEIAAWQRSPASRGLNSAGETKIPPSWESVEVSAGEILVVLKARTRFACGHFIKPKCSKVMRVSDGEIFYLERMYLKSI